MRELRCLTDIIYISCDAFIICCLYRIKQNVGNFFVPNGQWVCLKPTLFQQTRHLLTFIKYNFVSRR